MRPYDYNACHEASHWANHHLKARDYALGRGIIIADTKFEFGLDPTTDEVVLADEVLTPGIRSHLPSRPSVFVLNPCGRLVPLLAGLEVSSRISPRKLRQAIRARLARQHGAEGEGRRGVARVGRPDDRWEISRGIRAVDRKKLERSTRVRIGAFSTDSYVGKRGGRLTGRSSALFREIPYLPIEKTMIPLSLHVCTNN